MANKSLGKYISNKRSKFNVSSRQLAIKCNISPTYMNDIEKDKRVPTADILKKIGEQLGFDEYDMYKTFDLAAFNSNNKVPYDLVEYIMKNEDLRSCIRKKIKANDFSGWEKVLDENEEKNR